MDKDNLIEFAKEQCKIFPEDSYMGEYLRETIKMLQAEPCEDAISRTYLLKKFEDRFIELQKAHQKEKQLGINWCINTLKDMPPVKPTQRWIPIVCREATQDEKDSYFTQNGEELCFMIESEMPENGQEVLVSSNGYVSEDIFDEDYYSFENHEIVDVDAWMPLPEPYKESEEE